MANPRVRPFLHFYPEDTGGRVLAEACQAKRWLEEVAPELLTPMLRLGNHDFYIHEPAMLDDGSVCMPVRCFNRVTPSGEREWYAKCWRMEVVLAGPQSGQSENGDGWRVIEDVFETRAERFLKTFEELERDHGTYSNLPSPSNIRGELYT